MIFPQLNLNGTSADALVEQTAHARRALTNALHILQEAEPHRRDYFTAALGAYGDAREEHVNRLKKIQSVLDDLQQIEMNVRGQRDERREQQRHEEATLCIYCSERPTSGTHDPYCGPQCAIDAQKD